MRKLTLIAVALLTVSFITAQNMGIGTSTPAFKLDVNGDGGFYATSPIALSGTALSGGGLQIHNASTGFTTRVTSKLLLDGRQIQAVSTSAKLIFPTPPSTSAIDTLLLNPAGGGVKIGSLTGNNSTALTTYGNVKINGYGDGPHLFVNGDVGINGNLYITNSIADKGKVLTSDLVGNATWQYPAQMAKSCYFSMRTKPGNTTKLAYSINALSPVTNYDGWYGMQLLDNGHWDLVAVEAESSPEIIGLNGFPNANTLGFFNPNEDGFYHLDLTITEQNGNYINAIYIATEDEGLFPNNPNNTSPIYSAGGTSTTDAQSNVVSTGHLSINVYLKKGKQVSWYIKYIKGAYYDPDPLSADRKQTILLFSGYRLF